MPKSAQSLDELYEHLGDAIAAVLEHPDCPTRVYNELGETVCNLTNLPRGIGVSGAQARSFMPQCLSIYSAQINKPD